MQSTDQNSQAAKVKKASQLLQELNDLEKDALALLRQINQKLDQNNFDNLQQSIKS